MIPDLEDVLTKLHKFKDELNNAIKFIDKIIKLFGSWDAAYDMVGEGGSITLESLTEIINDILIKEKK